MSTKKGIGYSMLTDRIYIGKQNKEKGMWVGEKEDITSDFINVVVYYIPVDTTRTIKGLESGNESIIAHVKNDDESIKRLINHLQKLIEKGTP